MDTSIRLNGFRILKDGGALSVRGDAVQLRYTLSGFLLNFTGIL